MKTSEKTESIMPAFYKAQKEMGELIKDSINPGYRSEFASLGAVLAVTQKAYEDNEIVITQDTEAMADGVIVVTRLIHSSGQWIESTCPVFMSKKDAQTTGSAISYGRRYGLKNLAGLIEKDDDDDGAGASDVDQSKRRDEETLRPITDTQMEEAQHLFTLLAATDAVIKATCIKYATDGKKFKKLSTPQQYIETMMKSEASAMIKQLNEAAKERGL